MYHCGMHSPCVLSCLSPRRVWWSITLSSELGVLSLHLKHPRSENQPKWTNPSYYLNTIFSYLASFIRTKQVIIGTWCCYFVLLLFLFSCVGFFFFFRLAVTPIRDSQSKSERHKPIQLNFAQDSQLTLKSSVLLGRWKEIETQILKSFLPLLALHEFTYSAA